MVRIVLVAILVVANVFIFSYGPRTLSVSFLDVGQGDSILIESPTGVQVLVDGGVNKAVLRELGSQLSFFDRSIDAVVATHPDADHVGGLSDVFNRYDVGVLLDSGVQHETSATAALDKAVTNEGVARILARRGMRLILGGGAYADVLFPDRDVSHIETNAGSIVLRVVYGENEFMLTGDAPSAIEGLVTSAYGVALQSDVLKAGHHGSKTSSSERFVQAVRPQYVVFSRGCDNNYGHPAKTVVALFERLNIPALDTCELGTITFRSNGTSLSIK